MTAADDRTGILIVRVWLESDAVEGLRARITQSLDSTGPEQTVGAAATPEDLYAAVRTWTEAFLAAAQASRARHAIGSASRP